MFVCNIWHFNTQVLAFCFKKTKMTLYILFYAHIFVSLHTKAKN